MRRFVQRNRARLAVTSVAFAAMATGAVALYPGASGADPQPAAVVAVSPVNSFQLLRGASSVSPPSTVAHAVGQAPSSFGLDLAAARQAAGTGAWLIPGADELCIAVEDSDGLGMSCASAAVAEQGGLAFVERSVDGGATTVVGAAPDGMTHATAHGADGSALAGAAVQESTYVVSGKGVTGATPGP
jgi:hypothetical protein